MGLIGCALLYTMYIRVFWFCAIVDVKTIVPIAILLFAYIGTAHGTAVGSAAQNRGADESRHDTRAVSRIPNSVRARVWCGAVVTLREVAGWWVQFVQPTLRSPHHFHMSYIRRPRRVHDHVGRR